MREAASQHGWQWVDAHREMSRQHGFCAKGGGDGTIAAGASAGEMAFPIRQRGQRRLPRSCHRFRGGLDQRLRRATDAESATAGGRRPRGRLARDRTPRDRVDDPTRPTSSGPICRGTRWYRSPNDAFLTVNLHYGKIGDRVSLTHFVASSGAFHPNAQGHAAAADAIRDVIETTGLLK